MSANKLATRYAKSLLDLSIEQGKVEEVCKDMRYISEVAKASKEFTVMLKSPLIYPDKKIKVFNAVLGGKISELTMAFIKIVTKKHREAYLDSITHAFIRQYNEYRHITPIKLTTAIALGKDQVDRLLQKVKEEAGLDKLEVTTEVDQSLIGGFVLQFDDKLFDASVSRGIDILKSNIQDNTYIKRVFK